MNKQNQNSGKGCLIALRSRWPNRRGQSVIEFTAFFVLFMAALAFFRTYISRGLAGRWKGIGDSLGQGRIYDPKYTVAECEFYPDLDPTSESDYTGWFDRVCFEGCQDGCGPPTHPDCLECVESCTSNNFCEDED